MAEDPNDVDTLTVSQTVLLSIDARLKRLENLVRQIAIDTQDTAVTVEEIQDVLDGIVGAGDADEEDLA